MKLAQTLHWMTDHRINTCHPQDASSLLCKTTDMFTVCIYQTIVFLLKGIVGKYIYYLSCCELDEYEVKRWLAQHIKPCKTTRFLILHFCFCTDLINTQTIKHVKFELLGRFFIFGQSQASLQAQLSQHKAFSQKVNEHIFKNNVFKVVIFKSHENLCVYLISSF